MYRKYGISSLLWVIITKYWRIKYKIYQCLTIEELLRHKVDFNPQKCSFIGRTFLELEKNSKIVIGDYFIARSGVNSGIDTGNGCKIAVKSNAELTIGKYSGMTNTVIQCHKKVVIGNYVNIGAGCMIMDSNFHSTDWRDRLDRKNDVDNRRNASVKIGNVVFIGARSIICKGVTIGDHSMIAAGSVVVNDIPSNEVWGGNPARFIKKIDIL